MSDTNYNIASWVEDYTADLLKRAVYKTNDVEKAKDLVQDTFLAATEKLHTFKGDSSPKTWLYSILNFKIIDYYRSKSKQTIRPADDNLLKFFTTDGEWNANARPQTWNSDEHLLDNTEFNYVLKSCTQALPDKWLACVQMKYLLNKKGEEICQELDITPTNLWQIIHRAKLNLRECIETNWFKE